MFKKISSKIRQVIFLFLFFNLAVFSQSEKTYVLAGVYGYEDWSWQRFEYLCRFAKNLNVPKENIILLAGNNNDFQGFDSEYYGTIPVQGNYIADDLKINIHKILSSTPTSHLIFSLFDHGNGHYLFSNQSGGTISSQIMCINENDTLKKLAPKLNCYKESEIEFCPLLHTWNCPAKINELSFATTKYTYDSTRCVYFIQAFKKKLVPADFFILNSNEKICLIQQQIFSYPGLDSNYRAIADSFYHEKFFTNKIYRLPEIETQPRTSSIYFVDSNSNGILDLPYLKIINGDTLLCLAGDFGHHLPNSPEELYCSGMDLNGDLIIGNYPGEFFDTNNNAQDDLVYITTTIRLADKTLLQDYRLYSLFPESDWVISFIFDNCFSGGFGNCLRQIPAQKVFFISGTSANKASSVYSQFIETLSIGLENNPPKYVSWGYLTNFIFYQNSLFQGMDFDLKLVSIASTTMPLQSLPCFDVAAENFFIYQTQLNLSVADVSPNNFTDLRIFPNPCNSSTKIYYSVTTAGNVRLVVYNLIGQQIEVLVDKFHQSGIYQINFNLKNLTSGTYFLSLQAQASVWKKKMTVVK